MLACMQKYGEVKSRTERVKFGVYRVLMVLCWCVSLEYHFTTREKMKKSIGAGDFIEWAEFSGNMYGTRFVWVIWMVSLYYI